MQYIFFLLVFPSFLQAQSVSILLSEFFLKSFTVSEPLYLNSGSKTIAKLNKGVRFTVSIKLNKVNISVQEKSFTDSLFTLLPDNPENIPDRKMIIDSTGYKHELRFTFYNKKIVFLNVLPLDEYLKGVIPYEMPIRDFNDYEALKAFCVVSRSYTLMKIQESRAPYQLTTGVNDQVFKGEKEPNPLYNMALSATAGQFIRYNEKPAIVFYHACCGGHTENSDNVFNKLDIPYLQGVEDPFCVIAPGFNWSQTVSASSLLVRLKIKDDYILNCTLSDRSEAGRVLLLELLLGSSKKEISGRNLRSLFTDGKTGQLMKSTFISEILLNKDTQNRVTELIFKGTGNGHGVGLCQWGAIGQSRAGKDYKSIIYYYFPDTDIYNENNPG